MAGSIKHAANFVTTLDVRPLRVPELTVNPANSAAAKVDQVRTLLTEAADAAARGGHSRALRAYQRAHALCYSVLNPGVTPGWFPSGVHLPLGPDTEKALNLASVKLMEAMRPDVILPVGPVRVQHDPHEVDARFAKVGFHPRSAAVAEAITSATRLLAKGEATEAVSLLERAAAEADDDQLKATALLNLSTALLGTGVNDRATETATLAAHAFEASGDRTGAVQALHAASVAARRAGDAQTAAARFAAANEKLRGLAPAPVDGDTPAPGGGFLRRLREGLPDAQESPFIRAIDRPVREFLRGAEGTRSPGSLSYIADDSVDLAPLRWLDRHDTIATVPVDELNKPLAARDRWSVGIPTGPDIAELSWSPGAPAPLEILTTKVYEQRRVATSIAELTVPLESAAITTAYLTHVYSYVIPVGLGDSHAALGDHERAEQQYLAAAGYSYLNPELEAPALWVRLARNLLAWGDRLYKYERADEAKDVYARIVREDGTADAASYLYADGPLAATGAVAKEVLSDPGAVAEATNPAVAEVLLVVLGRWANLAAGLDFFGLTYTPTFTFEYLQQAARGLAQQSVQAEREYINFAAQAEAEASARRDLESALALARTEASTQGALLQAAQADLRGADRAVEYARLRRDNAREARQEYESAGYWQYISQSIATAHGAGKDWHESEIRELAQQIESGSWKGDRGKLAAAATLVGGQKSYEYQLGRLDDQAQEAEAAIPIAQAQRDAAAARARAAGFQLQAANQRVSMVTDALNAFDQEVFTPELWSRMAAIVRDISRSYQDWAIAAARLMERAYNFETDSALAVIRPEYSVPATGDLLGSDLLLRDIDSFTHHFITAVAKKESQIKEVLSLRNEYPFAFREFLRTGKLSFDTSLHDFDRRHPGTFGQRLQGVEVEIIGLVAAGGVRGTLRGGGISHYRTADGGDRTRVHGVDTMVLSDYVLRGDAYVFRADVTRLGLFEGHGIATSWELELPPGSNNLDYRLLSDVQLVLYYTARHSEELRDQVLATPPRPGEDVHVRDFAVRFDFPEVWFGMLRDATVTLVMDADSFPRNETALTTAGLALVLEGASPADVAGVDVTIGLPGRDEVRMTTDADGAVAAAPGNDLGAAMGGEVLGDWTITLEPPAGSPLTGPRGGLDAGRLRGASLVLQYRFEYRK